MSGAFPTADSALLTPARSGALPASTAEVFRNVRRETAGDIFWGDCMVERKIGASGINGRDKQIGLCPGLPLGSQTWRDGRKTHTRVEEPIKANRARDAGDLTACAGDRICSRSLG